MIISTGSTNKQLIKMSVANIRQGIIFWNAVLEGLANDSSNQKTEGNEPRIKRIQHRVMIVEHNFT